MDSANRGGTENRQAHRNCRGRASFLRATQRDRAIAKARVRDRAIVTSLGCAHSAGITPLPRDARFNGSVCERSNPALTNWNRSSHSVSKIMKSFITIITSVVCSFATVVAAPQGQTDQNPPPLDANNRDSSVKPGDDFFLFANGSWIKQTEIPPEYSRWGAFNELIERNNDALHTIAEKASQTEVDPKLAPETRKVGDYYASGMDEKAVETARTTPLTEEFQKIDAMKDPQDVLKEIAHLHSIGINAFFNFGSGQDAKDSNHDIAQAVQGGLGMPDRDYYTKQDADMKEKREKYIAHVTKMLTLLGQPPEKAAEDAKKIMALETKLAEASRTRVELRDPIKNYNKMAARQLQDLTPDWKWSDYFNSINLLEPGDINVHQPEFFKAVNNLFKSTTLDDWKAYLRWNLINATAPYLSKDF